MDIRTIFLLLAALVALVTSTKEDSKISKRDTSEEDHSSIVSEALQDEDEKRANVFRYGRGGNNIFRYGKRGSVFRYGKRGPNVFRYGKREDEPELEDAYEDELYSEGPEQWKRLFRWGKRDGNSMKSIFRWGKRSDDADVDANRQVFRYGKRSDLDDVMTEMLKRKMFALGKRNDGLEEAEDKRSRVFRYGRSGLSGPAERDVRTPNQPHVPFRFGDRE